MTDLSKQSQSQQILEYLQTGARLTPLEAVIKFGCLRLGARIWDLRHAGYDIRKETVTKNKKTFAEYYLEKENQT